MITGPWLFVVFIFSIVFVLISVIKFHMNAFIALLLTSILTGLLVNMPLSQISENIAIGFGNTLKGIGLVIGLGIILGRILSVSVATEQIAQALIRAVGEKNAPLAVAFTGYLVSIPVFFDAGFVILVSIIRKLSSLIKRPMIMLTAALAIGLITSHNLIVPTPGPVEVANNLKMSIGVFVIYALILAIPGVLLGWLYSIYLGKKETFVAEAAENTETAPKNIQPSTTLSFLALLLPIVLILLGSVMTLVLSRGTLAYEIFAFIGNKNMAMLISVGVAILALAKYIPGSANQIMMEATEKAGLILLVTGVGGSFGYVIDKSGIGLYLVETLSAAHISILFTGFILSAVLKGAQGSSTVALVTASSILGPIVAQTNVSPVLIGLAICAGGNCLSFPNDSAFWVVTRFADLKINETIKAWTVGATLSGGVIFLFILVLSQFAEFLPGLH